MSLFICLTPGLKDLAREECGPIDSPKDPVKDIRQTPYPLPTGFAWKSLDVTDKTDVFLIMYIDYSYLIFMSSSVIIMLRMMIICLDLIIVEIFLLGL